MKAPSKDFAWALGLAFAKNATTHDNHERSDLKLANPGILPEPVSLLRRTARTGAGLLERQTPDVAHIELSAHPRPARANAEARMGYLLLGKRKSG